MCVERITTPAVRDLGEQVAEAHALLGVEADGRLVDDHELRIAEQRLGDADALPHAARVAAEAPVGGAVEVDELEQLAHAAVELDAREALQPPEVEEELARGQPVVDAEVLRQVAELAAQRQRVARRVPAVATGRRRRSAA